MFKFISPSENVLHICIKQYYHEEFKDVLLPTKYPHTSGGVFQCPPSLHAWRQVPVISSYTPRNVCMLLIQTEVCSITENVPALLPMEHIPAHGADTERDSEEWRRSVHQP